MELNELVCAFHSAPSTTTIVLIAFDLASKTIELTTAASSSFKVFVTVLGQ